MEPGEKIVEARKRHGWSQAQLANRVGISQPAIKKIEAGETRQSKFMPKIAQVLGLDIADLIADLNTDLTIGQDARATGAGGPSKGSPWAAAADASKRKVRVSPIDRDS